MGELQHDFLDDPLPMNVLKAIMKVREDQQNLRMGLFKRHDEMKKDIQFLWDQIEILADLVGRHVPEKRV